MRCDRYRSLLAAAVMIMTPAGFAAAADSEGFQCEFPLAEGRQSLRFFTLTPEVYQCMLQGDYADLSVVNMHREPVPFRLITPGPALDTNHYRLDLPVYREPAASPYKTGEQIKRIAQLSGEVSGMETSALWALTNSFYSSLILQRDETEDELESITINTAVLDAPVNTLLIVEESPDLQHWKTLFGPHVLYILPGEQGALKNNTLHLGAAGGLRYLRIAMLSSIENFAAKITGISGEYAHSRQMPLELQWLKAEHPEATDKANEWVVSLPGLFPVSRIRLTPAEDMVYYKGALSVWIEPMPLSATVHERLHAQGRKKVKRLAKEILKGGDGLRLAPHEQGSWQSVTHFMQYRLLTEDGSMNSPDIRIDLNQGRRWKFVFNQQPSVTQERLPLVEFGWQPLQVMFVAQGSGPFRLLAGKAQTVPSSGFPNLASADVEPQMVELLAAVPATASEAAVTAAPAIFSWRTLMLWLILLLGVATMAIMVYRLAGSMNNK